MTKPKDEKGHTPPGPLVLGASCFFRHWVFRHSSFPLTLPASPDCRPSPLGGGRGAGKKPLGPVRSFCYTCRGIRRGAGRLAGGARESTAGEPLPSPG